MFDVQQTVASVVLNHSECAEVFQRHRIDFCCRGNVSVEAAARDRGLAVEALGAELEQTIAGRRSPAALDPRTLGTAELIAHIVGQHHASLRRTLPVVQRLAVKVSRVHGDHNPKLRELEEAVLGLVEALGPHLDDEERTVFPALTAPAVDPATVAQALASMQAEHLVVAGLLERARAASEDYTLPDWACTSYRTLFSELHALERDVFTHVHLENHVLLPRFAAG